MRIRMLATALVVPALVAVTIAGGPPGGLRVGVAGADTTTVPCPQSNPPDRLVVAAGTPQTARIGTTFQTDLAVRLASSSGCPVTTDQGGVSVTFTAPATGASGTFSSTGTNRVTVGTTSSGEAAAPPFTAGTAAGSYSVVATSVYGSVSFSLTNTSTGVAASITASGGTPQSATVGDTFAAPLVARVVDSGGAPVVGATVSFAIVAENGAGATFVTGGSGATAATDSTGEATSPPLTAGSTAGSYTAVAVVSGLSRTAPFQLANLASAPHTIVAGAGASQSAPVGASFPIPLAVTVEDEHHNPVPGAVVTFRAAASGATGTFAGGGATATATTDSHGIAVAPTFTANGITGGYIVTAGVSGVSPPASFALVNRAGTGAAPSLPAPTDVTRLAGDDRIATALAISRDASPGAQQAGAVVLASSRNFPDALVAAPLAAANHGPVLLTEPTDLTPGVLSEINRVLPAGATVYLIGGADAVSVAVETSIRGAGYSPVRVGGATRYETAVLVAQTLHDPATLIEADGDRFADAVVSGAAAAKAGGAVLLTQGPTLPPATQAYLASRPGATRYAVGGQAAAADRQATAIVGADRYATAVHVAERFWTAPTTASVASGANWPDALAGGAHAFEAGGPLLLTDAAGLSLIAGGYLHNNATGITHAYVYGGPAAVADLVMGQIQAAIT